MKNVNTKADKPTKKHAVRECPGRVSKATNPHAAFLGGPSVPSVNFRKKTVKAKILGNGIPSGTAYFRESKKISAVRHIEYSQKRDGPRPSLAEAFLLGRF